MGLLARVMGLSAGLMAYLHDYIHSFVYLLFLQTACNVWTYIPNVAEYRKNCPVTKFNHVYHSIQCVVFVFIEVSVSEILFKN